MANQQPRSHECGWCHVCERNSSVAEQFRTPARESVFKSGDGWQESRCQRNRRTIRNFRRSALTCFNPKPGDLTGISPLAIIPVRVFFPASEVGKPPLIRDVTLAVCSRCTLHSSLVGRSRSVLSSSPRRSSSVPISSPSSGGGTRSAIAQK